MSNKTENFTTISICMDRVWAGSGRVVNDVIENCGAQFCDDQDESEAVYCAIESAIKGNRRDLKIEIDGQVRCITWSIVEPQKVEES